MFANKKDESSLESGMVREDNYLDICIGTACLYLYRTLEIYTGAR